MRTGSSSSLRMACGALAERKGTGNEKSTHLVDGLGRARAATLGGRRHGQLRCFRHSEQLDEETGDKNETRAKAQRNTRGARAEQKPARKN